HYNYVYITLPYLLMLAAGLWFGRRYKKLPELAVLVAFWFFPTLALAIFSKGTSSRWIYPFSLPLIPVVAFGIFSVSYEIWKRLQAYSLLARRTFIASVIIVIILYPGIQTVMLIVNPLKANIAFEDHIQYYACATWAIRDIVRELKTEANGKPIF